MSLRIKHKLENRKKIKLKRFDDYYTQDKPIFYLKLLYYTI